MEPRVAPLHLQPVCVRIRDRAALAPQAIRHLQAQRAGLPWDTRRQTPPTLKELKPDTTNLQGARIGRSEAPTLSELPWVTVLTPG